MNLFNGVIVHPFFRDYFDCLQELHKDIERSIEGLSQEALDWIQGSDMNSICVLVMHLTGAERYWIGDVIGCDPSGRDRDAEFRVHGLDAEVLKARLIDTLSHTRGVLNKLSIGDLEASRISTRDSRKYTVAWALAHALEHTARHLGHIQILRRLWNQHGEHS